MAQTTKTDNHNMAAKLALRRHFIDKYHAGEYFSVFDCCQGDGKIWKRLGREYQFSYWGVDVKKRSGRLMVESERVLGIEGFSADVVDVDTYGNPWGHWMALLPNVTSPTTVFLTEGFMRQGPKPGGGSIPNAVKDAIGLTFATIEAPKALFPKFAWVGWKYMIAQAGKHGLRVKVIVEAKNEGGNARYFGVRLEPAPALAASGTA